MCHPLPGSSIDTLFITLNTYLTTEVAILMYTNERKFMVKTIPGLLKGHQAKYKSHKTNFHKCTYDAILFCRPKGVFNIFSAERTKFVSFYFFVPHFTKTHRKCFLFSYPTLQKLIEGLSFSFRTKQKRIELCSCMTVK